MITTCRILACHLAWKVVRHCSRPWLNTENAVINRIALSKLLSLTAFESITGCNDTRASNGMNISCTHAQRLCESQPQHNKCRSASQKQRNKGSRAAGQVLPGQSANLVLSFDTSQGSYQMKVEADVLITTSGRPSARVGSLNPFRPTPCMPYLCMPTAYSLQTLPPPPPSRPHPPLHGFSLNGCILCIAHFPPHRMTDSRMAIPCMTAPCQTHPLHGGPRQSFPSRA